MTKFIREIKWMVWDPTDSIGGNIFSVCAFSVLVISLLGVLLMTCMFLYSCLFANDQYLSGNVEQMREEFVKVHVYKIEVNQHWFEVNREEYQLLRVGESVTVKHKGIITEDIVLNHK